MTTLHLYSNRHIKNQVKNIKVGDWVYIQNSLSRNIWGLYFRGNGISEDDLNITYITQEEFFNLTNMRFDSIIGNPPFAKKLHLKFIDKALQMSSNVVMIAPVRGWWVGKHKANHVEKYSQQGLYLVEDKGLPFEGVFTGEIGVFYFNKGVEFIRDDFGQKDPLSNSIVDQYVMYPMVGKRTAGSLKGNLLDSGKYRVVLTSMQDGYTNDDNLFEDKSRGNWRVGFNVNGNKGGKGVFGGRIQVVAPTDYLSLSMSCLVVSCEKEAQEVCDYLMSDEIIKLMCDIKVSCTNSKYHMSFIEPYTC